MLGTAQQAARCAAGVTPVPGPPVDCAGQVDGTRCSGGRCSGGVCKIAVDFATNRLFPAGNDPFSVALADLDGDGIADLAVANDGDDTAAVLIGNGDGTFQPPRAFAAGEEPWAIVVGDFDGDHVNDLAVTDNGSGEVTVLLGDGHGGFTPSGTFPAVDGAGALAVGDFNHDGHLDLVVLSASAGQGGVLLGDGHGQFAAPLVFDAPVQPSFYPRTGSGTFAVGDFDRDGALDLAVANSESSQVEVFLGKGDGTFQAPRILAAGAGPSSVAAADFNHDGALDLAVTNESGTDVSVFLGNGDGTFQGPKSSPSGGSNPLVLASGDFDGDGNLDLAVENLFADLNLAVLLGNGDGTFRVEATYASSNAPNSVVVGDVNGDGRLDVVSTDGFTGAARVLLGNGDGTFRDFLRSLGGVDPIAIATGDFDNDCIPDLVLGDFEFGTVDVLLGNGDGTFKPALTIDLGVGANNPTSVTVGDLDLDGNLDIVVATDGVTVVLGNGDGTFQAPIIFDNGLAPVTVVVGDFNVDGRPDIAAVGGSVDVTVLLGNGANPLDFTIVTGNSESSGVTATAGDYNRDGIPDLAIAPNFVQDGPGFVQVLLGDGTGAFTLAATLPTDAGSSGIATADLDGDGILDLAVANFQANDVSVLLGNGDGSFQPAVSFPAGEGPSFLAIADFNADGKPDLVVTNSVVEGTLGTEVNVLLGNGSAHQVGFAPSQRFGTGYFPFGVTIGDFDLDGQPDIAVTALNGSSDAGVNVLLDRSGGVNLCPLGTLVGSTNLESPFAFTDDCALAAGGREQQYGDVDHQPADLGAQCQAFCSQGGSACGTGWSLTAIEDDQLPGSGFTFLATPLRSDNLFDGQSLSNQSASCYDRAPGFHRWLANCICP